jgi:hypothetical protein
MIIDHSTGNGSIWATDMNWPRIPVNISSVLISIVRAGDDGKVVLINLLN